MKKYRKAATSMLKGSLITGVGASVVTQSGGNAAGLNSMASMAPMMGTAAGSGSALGMLKKLGKGR